MSAIDNMYKIIDPVKNGIVDRTPDDRKELIRHAIHVINEAIDILNKPVPNVTDKFTVMKELRSDIKMLYGLVFKLRNKHLRVTSQNTNSLMYLIPIHEDDYETISTLVNRLQQHINQTKPPPVMFSLVGAGRRRKRRLTRKRSLRK
jgi:hypothetical protein